MTKTILRLPEVRRKTGLASSTIYLKIAQGDFPHAIRLGVRSVGWIESEIDGWINAKIESRDNHHGC
jgi:prophage regulatory protein